MTNNNQKIPAIRFKGFTDAWEQREFEDVIISIQTGTNLLGSESNHGTPLIKMGNIQRGFFSFKKVEFLNENEQVEEKNMANFGDFLFNTRNTLELVGKGATWFGKNDEYAFNSNIARFTFEGINTTFFNYLYNTPQMIKQVQARAVGTTSVAAVYPKDLNSIKFWIPSANEQQKIGALFKQLDDTIALHQRQLDNYKELKKAMLQKIFNQELRFKNDDGNDYPDWREVILEEICLYKSSNISLDSFKEYNGEEIYPLYDANSLVLNIDKYDQENEYVSIIKDGAGVGRIRYCEGKSSVLGTMGYLLPTDTVDIKFLYFRLQIINFLSYVSGSTIPHIYFKDYKKENIGLPCEDEQKKIADVLSALDIKIEILVQKIEALKQQKKGFMQQMFV